MTRTCQFTLVLLGFILLLNGCCVATELKVTNRTGRSIQFYTGHTQKTVQISADATATIPHTMGRIIVTTPQGVVWKYDGLDVPDPVFAAEITKKYKRLTLPLTINSSGIITLHSGRTIEPIRN